MSHYINNTIGCLSIDIYQLVTSKQTKKLLGFEAVSYAKARNVQITINYYCECHCTDFSTYLLYISPELCLLWFLFCFN